MALRSKRPFHRHACAVGAAERMLRDALGEFGIGRGKVAFFYNFEARAM
jgi:hypothetical protein